MIKEFSLNKNIIVSKPDKGRGIVIVDRVDYLNSMHSIISDNSKFSLIDIPIEKFTLKIEDKINTLLRKIKNVGIFSQDIINKLYVSGSAPGVLYGLPKIHKIDFSTKFQFRPILAAYKMPNFNLAKFLIPFLYPLTTNEYTCVNSYSFAKEISKYTNADNLFMASFDVVDLYTNIPLHETINIIMSKLFTSSTSVMLGLSRTIFKNLLELSVLNSFFVFNNKYYKQTDGLGMGQPLSPTFANIFLCHYEEQWLLNCPDSFKPVFYRRYIDDTFILFNDQSHVPLFLNYLNSCHSNIKFTCETEISNKLPFLDVNVHRNLTSFDCSVYRKPSFSGLGISNFSFCSYIFKLNSIKTLLHRAYHISSNYFYLDNEFNFLVNFYNKNGFCSSFIYKQINFFLSKMFSPPINSPKVHFKYIVLPYFGAQSENLKTELSIVLNKYFLTEKFRIILINPFSIGNFFNFKDHLPRGMQSSVIYSFCCEQCSSSYIGMTSRNLYKRVAEHAGRSFRTNSLLSHPSHSSIREHTTHCQSPISINNFKIIQSCSNPYDLKILESLHILDKKPSLNSMNSSYPLKIVK